MGWISPNARCPVCGASVYFYGNQNGSRVFFDDVGPPWPKHPCTDNGTAPAGAYRALSRRDYSSTHRPSDLRDRRWKSYAVKDVIVEQDHSRIVLQPLSGSGTAPTWTVSGRLPLRAEDLVFVRAKQLSYFDTAAGEPVTVEDAKHVAGIARKLITERDKQHVIGTLAARVVAGEMTLDEMGMATVAIQAARTRGDLADAIKVKVTDLKVAPPRPGDLWMLGIAFVLMVAVTSSTNGLHSYLVMLPGLLLAATAIFRLNPDMERGPRVLLAVLAALVMICPAGCVGGAIQVEILQR